MPELNLLQQITNCNLSFVTQLRYKLDVDEFVVTCNISPPADSAYFGQSYEVVLTFSSGNIEYIHFNCCIEHSQIDAMGCPVSLLFHWQEKLTEVKSVDSIVQDLLRLLLIDLHQMFLQPLPFPPPSDEELYHDYMHSQDICTKSNDFKLDEKHFRFIVSRLRDQYPQQVQLKFEHVCKSWQSIIRIQQSYEKIRLHPMFFDKSSGWCREWFDPSFLSAVDSGDFSLLRKVPGEGNIRADVYSFPMFCPSFCDRFIEEIHQFQNSGLPNSRPNSMNKYGVLLNYIGMEPMFDALLAQYILPLASRLYPAFGGATLDHHHTFVVQYAPDKDRRLDMHTDDSDVTVNIALSPVSGFQGGDLDICGLSGTQEHRLFRSRIAHLQGHAILHLGLQRHGALDVVSGERNNLIVWCRSRRYRMSEAYLDSRGRHHAERPPDARCLSRAHDEDIDRYATIFETTAVTPPSTL
jgi:hypothetical protein